MSKYDNLDDCKENLQNTIKIYKSIADTMAPAKSGEKEMVLRIG